MKTISFKLDSAIKPLADILISKLRITRNMPVILCIGSDRITGDCLGPLCGHLLSKVYNIPCFVYGTLEMPVTANTLTQTLNFINSHHSGQKVWAVDACMGNPQDIGIIKVSSGLYPGSAFGKNLPKAGNLGISAYVSANKIDDFQSARLGLIYKLANIIALSLYKSISIHNSIQKIYVPSYIDNTIISAAN